MWLIYFTRDYVVSIYLPRHDLYLCLMDRYWFLINTCQEQIVKYLIYLRKFFKCLRLCTCTLIKCKSMHICVHLFVKSFKSMHFWGNHYKYNSINSQKAISKMASSTVIFPPRYPFLTMFFFLHKPSNLTFNYFSK